MSTARIVLVVFCAVSAFAGKETLSAQETVTFGALHDDRVFTSHSTHATTGFEALTLCDRQTGRPLPMRSRTANATHNKGWWTPWRLRNDFFWTLGVYEIVPVGPLGQLHRFRLSDIPGKEDVPAADFVGPIALPRGGVATPREFRRDVFNDGGHPPDVVANRCDPLLLPIRLAEAQRTDRRVYYDIVPAGEDRCRLFVRVGDRVYVWDYRFEPVKEMPVQKTPGFIGKWTPIETIAAEFAEPFYTFDRDGKLFFVTESGTCYAVLDRGPDKGKQAVVLREAGNDPIQVLLEDLDTGRAYAFGGREWFELGAKYEPRPFKLVAPAAEKEPQRALELLSQCAKLVAKGADAEKK